ncbi:MAG: Histidinol-phosphatase [Eubacteriales bacterium SKADARSKE-1]|nr:Histidinol-phosphatase [Eubacteriales bacterium SKADARSKE-1]
MNRKFISDSHIHSDNSSHAQDPIIKICESALALDLFSITIVDNCECDKYNEREYKKSLRQLFFEAVKAQSIFKKNLNVLCGVELGQPHINPSAAIDAIASSDFDFILASIHRLKNLDNFLDIDYSDSNVYDVLDNYFNEVLDLIDWGNFNSLAHLNYPLKHLTGNLGIYVDSEKILKKVRLILEKLANKDKALEINTSINSLSNSSILSNSNLLLEFKKLGGKYVTIGSGAHESDQLAFNVEETVKTLKESGFSEFTVFKRRVPICLPI